MVGEDRWPDGVSNLQNSRPHPNVSAGLVPTDKLVNIRPYLEKLKMNESSTRVKINLCPSAFGS